MDQMDLYNHLPIHLQNMACCFEGRRIQKKRYSKKFHKIGRASCRERV